MFDCDFHSSIIGLSSLAKVVAFNTVVFVSSNAVFVVSLSAFSFLSTLLGSGTQINVMFVPDTHSLIVLYLFCYVCCVFLAFQYEKRVCKNNIILMNISRFINVFYRFKDCCCFRHIDATDFR